MKKIKIEIDGIKLIKDSLRHKVFLQKNIILELHNDGLSNDEIGKKIELIDRRYIREVIKKYGGNIPTRDYSDIENFKDIINDYQNDVGIMELTKKYNYNQKRISTLLKKHKVYVKNTMPVNKINFGYDDIKLVEKMRYDDKKPLKEIADYFNVTRIVIKRVMKENGIYKKIRNTIKNRVELDVANIIDLYINKNKTLKEIEVIYDCTERTIAKILKENDVKLRKPGQTNVIRESKSEKEIKEFVKKYITVKSFDRTILNGKELDIFIPEKNIGIELNGLYWHSENGGKDRNYHLDKTTLCEQNNVQLLHVFEDEWKNKQDIVKSIIKNKIGMTKTRLYGRKCTIKEVDTLEKKTFLNNNHIQGNDKSSIKYGLYYNNELVSLITVGKSRYNKNYEWELLRFCNKLDTTVVGGFSKLLKHFRKNHNGSMITYADKRYSNGSLYKNNGFDYLHDSTPNYFYLDKKIAKRESRIKYQKHKLKDILETFDPKLSEWKNMMVNGYNRIWDCGNKVFVLL